MKRAFELLMVVALAVSILACSPAAQQAGAGSGLASGQEPKYGGVLRYAAAGLAPNVHPYTNAASGTDIVIRPVYEWLLNVVELGGATEADPEGSVRPWLAESWTNPNSTTYVFKIRQGVKWQDGRDFTAQDVVFTWDFLLKNKGQFSKAASLSGVQSFKAIDTYTVELVSKVADADLLRTMASIVMIPQHLVEGGSDLTKVIMGTGAFKVKDFNTARGVVHVRNENYWYKGLPYLDGIVGYYNMDRSAMIAAMTVGQLDIFNPENDPQLQTVQSGVPNLQYAGYTTAMNYSLMPKLTEPPFNDLRVRRAMNLAIDRQAINNTISGGKGTINPPVVPGWNSVYALPQEELLKMPGYNPATKQQDIAEAKRLLAEAGYPNGFRTTLVYQTQFSGPPPIAEIASTQLKAIGIDVVLKPLENNLFNDTVTLKGNFEVKLESGGSDNFGNTLFTKYYSTGVQNKQGIADQVLDGLIERQKATLDEKERQKIVQDIQRRIFENAYVMPTFDAFFYSTWQPWVHNYIYSRSLQTKPGYQPMAIWLDSSMMAEGRLKEDAGLIGK